MRQKLKLDRLRWRMREEGSAPPLEGKKLQYVQQTD